MRLIVNPSNIDDYRRFLAVKSLPSFRCTGRELSFPDEYAHLVSGSAAKKQRTAKYKPWPGLFDYQADIAAMAIAKRKFAVFADCGLGKTLMLLEFMRHAAAVLPTHKRLLIVCPLMVVRQTIAEANKFYEGSIDLEQVSAADLAGWLRGEGNRLGITNYDALTDDLKQGALGCLILDESSVLKSHYGKWGQVCLDLGAGLDWKLCLTGTPAPNDRIEYANHAVFLDAFPTINAFLARYFVNRGQTQERWVLKPHAIGPFYRALSHWSIFLSNPATYGWKDNAANIPPIHTHIHHIDMTDSQRSAVIGETGELFVTHAGGITKRSKLARIGKGTGDILSRKPAFIKELVESWPDESTIIWCLYNEEQDGIAKMFPGAANIDGSTPMEEREVLIDWFKGVICTCERQKRIANICKRTTQPTKTNGKRQERSEEAQLMHESESNTPTAQNCKSITGRKQKSGSEKTLKRDSHKTSGPTGSLPTTIAECSLSKEMDAPSADSGRRNAAGSDRGCTSIIAMKAESFADCSAETATTESGSLKTTQNSSKRPLCTCEIGRPRGRILLSKARVLGFGLNLQIATRQVFSGLQDSYESYYQAVKRSNRVGSTRPLNVHIPVTEVEVPMIESVLRKADRVQADTDEQEKLFKSVASLKRGAM